jgi:osmotically-inducible protein OsmY
MKPHLFIPTLVQSVSCLFSKALLDLPPGSAGDSLGDPRSLGPRSGRRRALTGLLTLAVGLGVSGCDLTSIFSSVAQERGVGGFFKDNQIWMRAQVLCNQNKKFHDVHALVHRGKVLLMGRTQDQETRQEVEGKIKSIPHVARVINHIQVGPRAPSSSGIQDRKLKEKLAAALFFDTSVSSRNMHVAVVDRVAYILGTAASAQEVRYAVQHAEALELLNVITEIEILPPEASTPPAAHGR